MTDLVRELILNSDSSRLYTSTSNNISVYDTLTGNLINQCAVPVPVFDAEHEEQLKKTKSTVAETSNLRYLRITSDDRYLLGTLDDSKVLLVLDTETLKVINQILFPKRPCCLDLIAQSTKLIAGDKFGDVFQTDFLNKESKIVDPILGHVSMLVDIKMAHYNGQQFIISADRDEHIRVTKYPQTYIIDRWLFGHSEFVSSLCLIPKKENLLISGGGDDFIFVWDWTTGELKDKFDIRRYVEDYLDETHAWPVKSGDGEKRGDGRRKSGADVQTEGRDGQTKGPGSQEEWQNDQPGQSNQSDQSNQPDQDNQTEDVIDQSSRPENSSVTQASTTQEQTTEEQATPSMTPSMTQNQSSNQNSTSSTENSLNPNPTKSQLEITVQKIAVYQSRENDQQQLLILCEGTNILLNLKLDSNDKLEFIKILKFDSKILDFTTKNSTIGLSFESRDIQIELITKQQNHLTIKSYHEQCINDTSNLYLLKTLRKRNDF